MQGGGEGGEHVGRGGGGPGGRLDEFSPLEIPPPRRRPGHTPGLNSVGGPEEGPGRPRPNCQVLCYGSHGNWGAERLSLRPTSRCLGTAARANRAPTVIRRSVGHWPLLPAARDPGVSPPPLGASPLLPPPALIAPRGSHSASKTRNCPAAARSMAGDGGPEPPPSPPSPLPSPLSGL